MRWKAEFSWRLRRKGARLAHELAQTADLEAHDAHVCILGTTLKASANGQASLNHSGRGSKWGYLGRVAGERGPNEAVL
jgi:hypothetical protein